MIDSTSLGRWWWPSPLVRTFWLLVAVNLLLIFFAFDVDSSSMGSDAAGNAMSNGFDQIFKYAALCVVAVPSLLFLLVRRWLGIRVAMVVLLGIETVVLLVLASFVHGAAV